MNDGYQAGLAIRRRVLGDEHVDRALAQATEVSRPWQDFVTTVAWGQIWTRDGLDRRTRSLLTVALLTALRCETELALHLRGAIANGVTPAEITEVLMHTAIYAGLPAANTAFGVAQQVLGDPTSPSATSPSATSPSATSPSATSPGS